MRPYRVQLVGGIVLHQGRIAEMKTGEGKTLVATLPAYLNALTGKGVHIVTVNDYLAKRDSEWMGKVYRFLGLTVGLVIHGLNKAAQQAAYAADITYGTNNEFGFDYLRDNMAIYASELVQRGHAFAIVDEVDSILIDEARTPLIISGQGEKSTQLYQHGGQLCRPAEEAKVMAEVDEKAEEDADIDADYIVDEKAKTATLTARGIKKAEEYFNVENLSDPENTTLAAPHQPGHQGPGHHEAGHRLRGEGRRGHHRRRVHRPSDVSAAATTRACIRPSRPRSTSPWPGSPRRWPPSPSRTTSACTTSSPA